jgi:lipoprotein NlpD
MLMLLLTACGGGAVRAPIVDGWEHASGKSNYYIVEPGDTLYSIAWAFGLDFRDLARANHLHSPYAIKTGQRLRMITSAATYSTPIRSHPTVRASKRAYHPSPPKATVVQHHPIPAHTYAKTQTAPSASATVSETAITPAPVGKWLWPTQGRVIQGFSPQVGGNRGLDITGHFGQPVVAAANGRVVYSGSSLPGYGKLIIIKHNDNFLSAYAFNKVLLAKEGMAVRAGQTIAEMGQDDKGRKMLHFEIRRNGKPVNPMAYLRR